MMVELRGIEPRCGKALQSNVSKLIPACVQRALKAGPKARAVTCRNI